MWKYEFFSYYLIDYERGDGNYPYNYGDYVLTRLFILFHNHPPFGSLFSFINLHRVISHVLLHRPPANGCENQK